MTKNHEERLIRAMDYAQKSAEYHIRDYAGGTLMPGDAYADMTMDERDRLYLGPDAGPPNMYSRIYRSQREKEMRRQGMTDAQIQRRWDALNAIWQREIEERLYGEARPNEGADVLIREYESEKAAGSYEIRDEQEKASRKKKNRIVWVLLGLVALALFVFGALDGTGIINGRDIVIPIFDKLDKILGIGEGGSVEIVSEENGAEKGTPGVLILVYGVVIFLIYKWIRKGKKSAVAGDSLYTELIPQTVRRRYGDDSIYDHQGGISPEQMRRLNCFGGRPFTLDGQPLPVVGRDLIEGTYRGVHFRSCYEYMEYEYYYEDSDGDREKKIDKLFGGIVVEIPYRKRSSAVIGLMGNSELKMKNILKSGAKLDPGGKISGTESDDFNLLFTIDSDDEENIFYILTPDVMEKLAALYPREKAALHVAFAEDRLYMCISSSDTYMTFDDEKRIKGMKDVEAYLDKYLRMLQEVIDAALLI